MIKERTYDIILYGATSHTAKFIFKHFVNESYNFALASRNCVSLEKKYNFPTINCEINEIDRITKNTKILLNCVGPYILTGEKIVESCVKNKTHYIDITGEPMFVNLIRDKFNEEARRSLIYIVNCCGFDSVPADLGIELLKEEILKESTCENIKIESTISVKNPVCNKTTWVSLIHSLGNYVKPVSSSNRKREKEYNWSEDLKAYRIIFRGIDHSVVKNTQKLVKECGGLSVDYVAYLEIGNKYKLFIYFIYILIIRFLSKFSLGKSLLIRFYRFFSFGLVADKPENIENTSFTMTFSAKSEDKNLKTLKINGPDPALNTTGICASQCALSLLELINEQERRSHLKVITGGIVTPGFIFKDSNLVTRLKYKGIKFEIN
jgi:short subunit dehydrogenase-like uncharacterized protein